MLKDFREEKKRNEALHGPFSFKVMQEYLIKNKGPSIGELLKKFASQQTLSKMDKKFLLGFWAHQAESFRQVDEKFMERD
jgi:hypothetical protein